MRSSGLLLRLATSGSTLLGRSSALGRPNPRRRVSTSPGRSALRTKTGSYLPHPEGVFLGSVKTAVCLIFSVWLGAEMAKHGAAALEELEIFVPEDDDD